MNQTWPSCYMRCLVFAIRKVSGQDVEGDRVSGFELVRVPREVLIPVSGFWHRYDLYFTRSVRVFAVYEL